MAQADAGDYDIRLVPDGVMSLAWKPGVRIEAHNARGAVDAVNKIAAGRRYPLLVKMANASHLSRAAREVFLEPCAALRIALLGNNPVDRMLAQYQLAVQEPPCPTRYFTSEDEAMAWLRNPSEQSDDEQGGRAGSLGESAP
jgi:hypothetical protein